MRRIRRKLLCIPFDFDILNNNAWEYERDKQIYGTLADMLLKTDRWSMPPDNDAINEKVKQWFEIAEEDFHLAKHAFLIRLLCLIVW